MHHPVSRGRPAAQAVQILQRPTMHRDTAVSQRRRAPVRPGQPRDLMTGPGQLPHHGRTNEPSSPSNKHPHDALPR